jgi:FkbM family methyltransferase
MFEYLPQEIRLIRAGVSVRDRARLSLMSARMHGEARSLDRFVPFPAIRRVQIDLASPSASLTVRSNDYVLFEIFGFGGYDVDLSPLGEIRTVLDAGANVGLATVALARRLPAARFVCVEPSPASFALLEQNLTGNRINAIAVHAALAGSRGWSRVEEGRQPAHTRVIPCAAAGDRTTVQALTISDVLDVARVPCVDLMKLDIEGGEAELLACGPEWAGRVRGVLAEIHPPLDIEAARRKVQMLGYRVAPLPNRPLFSNMLFGIRD